MDEFLTTIFDADKNNDPTISYSGRGLNRCKVKPSKVNMALFTTMMMMMMLMMMTFKLLKLCNNV